MRKLNPFNFTKNRYLIVLFLILIIILLFSTLSKKKNIQVNSVFPSPNSLCSSLIKPITINFTKEITPQDKKNIDVKIEPPLSFSQQWINNHKTLKLTPKFIFKEKTTYKVSIFFHQKPIYSWSFTTPSLNQVSPQEAIQIQGYQDPAGEELRKAYQERPWLKFLPIRTRNYSITYLKSKNAIRVLMKIDITSPLSREEQIAQIKNEAPKRLEEIGVDINKEKIYYTFTPEE